MDERQGATPELAPSIPLDLEGLASHIGRLVLALYEKDARFSALEQAHKKALVQNTKLRTELAERGSGTEGAG